MSSIIISIICLGRCMWKCDFMLSWTLDEGLACEKSGLGRDATRYVSTSKN